MKTLNNLSELDISASIMNQANNWAKRYLHVNENVRRDEFSLSEDITSLLTIYGINNDEKILKFIIAAINDHLNKVLINSDDPINLGMASICAELYKITRQKRYLTDSLLVIEFEQKKCVSYYSVEIISIRNLLTLLDLFSFTKDDIFLLSINRFIIKLLNYSCLEKGGLYWHFLYKLDTGSRVLYENLLKMVFQTLFKVTENDTFLYIARNIKTRPVDNTFQKDIIEPAYHCYRNYIEHLKSESILTDIAVRLNESMFSGRINHPRELSEIIKKVKFKHLREEEFLYFDAVNLRSLITGIVYYNAFKLTAEWQYYIVAKESVVSYLEIKEMEENNGLLDRSVKITAQDRLILSMMFPLKSEMEGLKVNDEVVNPLIFNVYPGISMSEKTAKRFILMGRFRRTLLVLMEALPKQTNEYLNAGFVFGKYSETAKFLAFVKDVLKSKPVLKKDLAPVFRLELAGHYLMNKYRHLKYGYEISSNLITCSRDMDEKEFSKLLLYTFGVIKVLYINLTPVLRTYFFTLGEYFSDAENHLVAVRYNPAKHLVEEVFIDEYDLIIIEIFKEEQLIEQGIQKVLKLLDYEPEQSAGATKSVISRIKKLIEEGVLIEYPIEK